MLVLSRSRNQEIVIGPDIRIRVGEVRGGRVTLLIEAPRSCTVRREEVVEPAISELAVAAPSA